MSCLLGAFAAQSKPRGLARTLWIGASVATLATLAAGGAALADVSVNGGDKPVATATATSSGAPDNIVQTGTMNVSTAPAITLNSNNKVTNQGTIQVQDKDNQTGVLALGGFTGAVTNTGTITFNSSSTLTSTDNNGVVTGPFANLTSLYGIHSTGAGALTGDIDNSGSITIQGKNSAGIFLEAPLSGSVNQTGTITVSGDNSFGIHATGSVGGNVTVTGAVTASGPNAQAVNLGGDVGGAVQIESAVTATGYHTTSRSTDSGILADQNKNDSGPPGGATVTIGGSVAKGVLVSAPPISLSSTNSDVNGDGIADSAEPTGTVTSYGSAPAILIGGPANSNSVIGLVGTGQSAYGVVIEGAVSGQGLRDNVSAVGMQIGGTGGAVSVTGGVSVLGTLSATAYGTGTTSATALHIGSGATVPVLYNANQLTATVTGESSSILSRGIVVDSGGSLPTVLNAGTISGAIIGSGGTAVAIQDNAGSLTHLENTGAITGLTTPASGSTLAATGTAIAIDDRNNITGLSLINYQGAAFTTAPSITGSILMGSGNDSIDMEAGAITGDLSFGGGANSLLINGGSIVGGVTLGTGGTLALTINNGSLQNNSATELNLTSLTLGAKSNLILTVDPTVATTLLNVNGTANVASGAKLGVRVATLFNGTQTFDLIHATTLNLGALDTSLLASTPYIYSASISNTANDVTLTIGRKTAAQLDLPGSIAGGYEPVVAAISGDPALSQALLLPTTRDAFIANYNQLLPEHSGGIFEIVRAGIEAFGRPLDDRQSPDGGGAWVQEVNVGAFASDKNGLPGYKAWGVGLIAGFESRTTPVGIFGLTIGGFSGELRPHGVDANNHAIANLIEAGGYWRATYDRFAFNARIAADHLTAKDERIVDISNNGTSLFNATATGDWNGWGVTGRMRASYEADWRSMYFRPQAGVDYLRLSEDAYSEHGGGAIDLAVSQRTTSQLAAFAGLAVGATFGQTGGSWGPELLLGYRDVVSNDDGLTTARFLSGGDSFTVGPNPINGGAGVIRAALKSESAWGAVSLEGGAEVYNDLTVYDAKLAVHLKF